MSDRISLSRSEFEAFLVENQALVKRAEELVAKIDTLEKANIELEKELKVAVERLKSAETELKVDTRQGDEAIRKARETITRLMTESDRRISLRK